MHFVEPGEEINVLFQFRTGATPDASISKDGEAFINTANNPVEISNGYFNLELNSGEISGGRVILVRIFDGSNPDYWTIIQTRALNAEIVSIVRSQLQNVNLPKVVADEVDKSNRGLKQFISTEHLTTRGNANRIKR